MSSVAFLVVGCWLLVQARNRVGAAALIAVGAGSIAYHGPQPGWAGPVHDVSVYGLAFVLVVQAVRLVRIPGGLLMAWKAAGPWFVVGLAAYVAGRTGSPWCRPRSLWQPHAIWHVLIAIGSGRAFAARDLRA